MQRAMLFRYGGVTLMFAALPLYLVHFEGLAVVSALMGLFSLQASRQGPRQAAASFSRKMLAYTGIWIVAFALFAVWTIWG